MTGTTIQSFHDSLNDIVELAETDKQKALMLLDLLKESLQQEINTQ